MKNWKFFFSLILFLFVIGFSGFVCCASNHFPSSEIVSDPSSYYVDLDNLSSFNGTMVRDLRFSVTSDSTLYYTLNLPFSDRDYTGISVGAFGDVRIAYYSGEFVNNSVPIFSLYTCDYISSRPSVSALSGFRYFYMTGVRFDGNSFDFARRYQLTSYVVQSNLIATNIPIFDDRDSMVNYLLTGEFSSDDIKNSDYLGNAPSIPSSDSLGFLTDVKYYVDSASYQYNPSNTPEYVSWGQYSSTGLDLYDSRYQVEFALEDRTQAYVNDDPASVRFLSDLTGKPIDLLYGGIRHFLGYVVTSGITQSQYQSKLYNFSTYGNVVGLGSVSASARKYSISAVDTYISALSGSSFGSDEYALYSHLNDFRTYRQKGYFQQVWTDFTEKMRLYSFSYNILARIVDTSNGVSGDWSVIDRHNSPYWLGDNYDVLNGGVTYGNNYITHNFNPTPNTFVSPSVLPSDRLPENEPVGVGVGVPSDGVDDSGNIFNNYTYSPFIIYRGDEVLNDYSIINEGDVYKVVYAPRSSSTPSGDDGVGLGEALGLIATFAVLWNWYASLFGGLLPIWAVICIPVFSGLFIAVTLWKFGRSLIG